MAKKLRNLPNHFSNNKAWKETESRRRERLLNEADGSRGVGTSELLVIKTGFPKHFVSAELRQALVIVCSPSFILPMALCTCFFS